MVLLVPALKVITWGSTPKEGLESAVRLTVLLSPYYHAGLRVVSPSKWKSRILFAIRGRVFVRQDSATDIKRLIAVFIKPFFGADPQAVAQIAEIKRMVRYIGGQMPSGYIYRSS